jgi:hypothetical protein
MEFTLERRRLPAPLAAFLLAALLAASPARAESPAAPARSGLALASAAAKAWAGDAELVYVENDEPLDAAGRAARWGYLFRSPSLGRSRAWSVKEGRIVTAEDLALRFDAPPLRSGWLDSDAAVAAAEKGVAQASRREARGRLQTLLLMRGATGDHELDAPTWTFVYSATGGGALHVVVDAATGKVMRTWRS